MSRIVEVTIRTLAAALAVSAFAVPVSFAQAGVLTADGPVTLAGTQTGGQTANSIIAFGLETSCSGATYAGHELGTTNPVPSGASVFTITPAYGTCSTAGFPSTVDLNGCDFVLEVEQTTEADRYFTTTTVVCPSGKHITLTIFGSAAKHTENSAFCHLTITENFLGSAGVAITTTTNGYVDLSGTASSDSADKKSPTGSILCSEASGSASIRVDITFHGVNASGGGTFISLSD